MDKILYNLALIDATQFCVKNNIDCSDTYLYKTPRKYVYTLLKTTSKQPVASVEFHKNSVPSYLAYRTY